MGARRRGDYPKNLADFYRRFPDDAACFRYLVETRWPDGFRCPGCGSGNARLMEAWRTWQCRAEWRAAVGRAARLEVHPRTSCLEHGERRVA